VNQTPVEEGLTLREILVGLALSCTSGLAIIAHTYGPVKLSFATPFIALPTAMVLSGLILLRKRLYGRLHTLSSSIAMGALYGLAATVIYDLIRPLLKWIFQFQYPPFRAMTIFGTLITGLAPEDPVSQIAGWTYHFWNGISFGMMYVLIWPRGGWISGLAWGLGLQLLMMIVYPSFLNARLSDPGFLTMGIVGHSFWGVVLGYLVRRRRHLWLPTAVSGGLLP
jgi:hypothetical protein